MTEEELRKKGEQINAANQQQTQQAPQPTNVPTPAAITDNNQSSVAQSVADMRQRAADYRDYASRPVTIDKSGQTNWLNEIERVRNQYVETPEQKAARERREKRDRRIASIADGLVAISNVAGAMAGATPVKPATTMSMAHKAAVDAAAKKRRENLNQYDIARRYYAGLQYKQDKDNADQLYKKAKARQDAGKQADLLDMNATKIEQTEARNLRADKRAKERYDEDVRHHERIEALQSERNSISRSKGSGGNGGSGSKGYTFLGKTYPNTTEYNRAVYTLAGKYGVPTTEKVNGTEIRKNVNKLAADVEAAAARKNKPNSKNIKWNGNKKRNSYI